MPRPYGINSSCRVSLRLSNFAVCFALLPLQLIRPVRTNHAQTSAYAPMDSARLCVYARAADLRPADACGFADGCRNAYRHAHANHSNANPYAKRHADSYGDGNKF